MSSELVELIRARSQPMDPVPTDVPARLRAIPGVRAVLFDVYGTLLTSGSGDVGTAERAGRGPAFVAALAAVGLEFHGPGEEGVAGLIETIHEHQQRNVPDDYPEVDIVEVWRTLLAKSTVREQSVGDVDLADADLQRLAIEYEARVNPVWPMPGARDTLRVLADSGRRLGIISNAQFFTPLLFPALFGENLDTLGFDPDLRFHSYRFLRAKPGTFLYERAVESLAANGISPSEVLYVGNDLLNDVKPAAEIGFRTALFAGDARSLRWRDGDPRVLGVEPDLVVTQLSQIPPALHGDLK